MDTKTVTFTVLVAIDVVADSNSKAEDAARELLDNGIFDSVGEHFLDGYNMTARDTHIEDVRFDVEGDAEIDIAGGLQ